MPRIAAPALVALTAATLLAACGGSGGVAADKAAAPAPGAQVTAMNTGDAVGADGDMAKIPQGMSLTKAQAAGLGKDGAPVVRVIGTETGCTPDVTSVKAGKVWFTMTNQGTKISEMYLETPDAKQLVEVESLKSGAAGAFTVNVTKGSYLVACEPGMADKQIRTAISVTD